MTAIDAFGADLYRQLAASEADLVFSPLSVSAALQLAWYGARGDTQSELTKALHLEGGPQALDLPDAGGMFRMSNTIWLQVSMRFQPDYLRQLEDGRLTTFGQVDFAHKPDQARDIINSAIAQATEDKIPDLLAPGDITSDDRLVLANAVYLKARWLDPFPQSATGDAPFHPGNGTDLTVSMMRGTATREYKRADGYQAVLLPYQDSPLAMAIILPDGPLADLDMRGGLRELLAGTARFQVDLRMPRFLLKTRLTLIPALQRLGVQLAFGPGADFTGMTADDRLHIGAVAHMAYIDVDEHGTEAAAATAVVMRALAFTRPPSRVEMIVDRPFLFAIVDTRTATPLFLGNLSTPS
jgi:serpin B